MSQTAQFFGPDDEWRHNVYQFTERSHPYTFFNELGLKDSHIHRFFLLHEQLMEALDTLTEREQQVLRLRFGLDDGKPRTLDEVGKQFHVTRERIRQIEAKALRKLRHPSRSKKLKDYLD